MAIRSATKKKLVNLGVTDRHSSKLADDRNWDDIRELTREQMSDILGLKVDGKTLQRIASLITPAEDEQKSTEDKPEEPKFEPLGKFPNLIYTTHHLESESKMHWHSIVGTTIENFKGFRSSGHIPLRHITLIFGPNNGGKSSVLKALASIPQSSDKRKAEGGTVEWSPSGLWFDLGNSPQILNDPDLPDIFSLGFTIRHEWTSVDELGKTVKRYREPVFSHVKFQFSFSETGDSAHQGILQKLEYLEGEFEDYMKPTFSLRRRLDDSTPAVPSVLSSMMQTSDFFPMEFENISQDLQIEIGIQAQLSENAYSDMVACYDAIQSTLDMADKAETPEEIEKHNQLKNKYICPTCDEGSPNLSKHYKHCKAEHLEEFKRTTKAKGIFGQRNCRSFFMKYREQIRLAKTFVSAYEKYNNILEQLKKKDAENIGPRLLMLRARSKEEAFTSWLVLLPHLYDHSSEDKSEVADFFGAELSTSVTVEEIKESGPDGLWRIVNRYGMTEQHSGQGEDELVRFSWKGASLPWLGRRKYFFYPYNLGQLPLWESAMERIESSINYLMENFFSSMDYLGATRAIPRREESSSTEGTTSQGILGQRTLAHLAHDKMAKEWVNEKLLDMIGVSLEIEPIEGHYVDKAGKDHDYITDRISVRVRQGESTKLQLPDVGFGISQLIPVLAALRTSSSLIIEEPESNLHPAAQAKLMKTVIEEIINRASNVVPSAISGTTAVGNVIMETHSEHFLMELLKHIGDPECPLEDDDVAILYVTTTPERGTVVTHMKTTNGSLHQDFPDEFTGGYTYRRSIV